MQNNYVNGYPRMGKAIVFEIENEEAFLNLLSEKQRQIQRRNGAFLGNSVHIRAVGLDRSTGVIYKEIMKRLHSDKAGYEDQVFIN